MSDLNKQDQVTIKLFERHFVLVNTNISRYLQKIGYNTFSNIHKDMTRSFIKLCALLWVKDFYTLKLKHTWNKKFTISMWKWWIVDTAKFRGYYWERFLTYLAKFFSSPRALNPRLAFISFQANVPRKKNSFGSSL